MSGRIKFIIGLAVLVGLIAAFLFSRQDNAKYINLAEEFPHAKQKKAAAFSLVKGSPALLKQKHSGSISFYTAIPPNSELVYQLQAQPEDLLEASVIVESDFPVEFREEYRAHAGPEQKIDLKQLGDRVARITLQAQVAKSVSWVAPRIRYDAAPVDDKALRKELQAIRDRHKDNNVMIVLFDAAGASHFGCYGYPRNTTAAVDRFAEQSVLFENAVSQAVYTLASAATLFTGIHPDAHGVLARPTGVSPSLKTFAEYFQDQGYKTAMFSASPNVSPMFGFHQGFEVVHRSAFSATQLVPLVNEWMGKNRNGKFFGYIHFREPHEPYDAPQEYLSRFSATASISVPQDTPDEKWPEVDRKTLANSYDANLAYVSEQFGKIVQQLEKLQLQERTIVVLVADHGEAFWEHGVRGHNSHVYEEMIRVPLILKIPGESKLKGTRRKTPVGLVDITPTLVDLFQIQPADAMDGTSMLPLLVQESGNRLATVQSQTTDQKYYGRRGFDFKFICHPEGGAARDEFYDLANDPQEKQNLSKQFPIFTGYHRMQMQRELAALRSRSEKLSKTKAVIDKETEEELRSLGYVN